MPYRFLSKSPSSLMEVNLPSLGPIMYAADNPAIPPVKCTTAEPAKSLKPILYRKPYPHTQAATVG
jgi:hypothetical protein